MQSKLINRLQDDLPMLKWQKDFIGIKNNVGVCYLEMEAHGVIEFNIVVQTADKKVAKFCIERLPVIFREFGAVHYSGLRALEGGEYTGQVQFKAE